jgi:hypothetical protein
MAVKQFTRVASFPRTATVAKKFVKSAEEIGEQMQKIVSKLVMTWLN